jgi:hypothetical protein
MEQTPAVSIPVKLCSCGQAIFNFDTGSHALRSICPRYLPASSTVQTAQEDYDELAHSGNTANNITVNM